MWHALMASEGGDKENLSGYIHHHLTQLANKHQTSLFDISVVHWDTLFFSVLCAVIVLIVLRTAASKATSGVPGKFQLAVETVVNMVNTEARGMIHGPVDYIAPLALT